MTRYAAPALLLAAAPPLNAATVIWAIIGVVVANWSENPLVSHAGRIGIAVLTAATASFWRNRA